MQEDRDYTVYPSDLKIYDAFVMLDEYLTANGYKPREQKTSSQSLTININQHRSLHAENFPEFLRFLKQYQNALPIYLHYTWDKSKDVWFTSIIDIYNSRIETSVRSYDLDILSSIHDRIRIFFQANNPEVEKSQDIFKYNLKKSIFLAHRFDEHGTKIANTLDRFLRRLGFDVKEGSGYETKSIPEKVSRKISSQDIFVCVFTPGDTSWILSETAYAKALNKYIVLLCEENLDVNKGIIGGDYEHLLFPAENIEKCFSDLLYALPS
jgi:hypothetical protein